MSRRRRRQDDESDYGYSYDGYDSSMLIFEKNMASYIDQSPLTDYYNTTVPASGGPQGLGGALFNIATKAVFGVENPFSFRNPYERPAGDLGAYGLTKFEGNAARMRAGASIMKQQSMAAAGELLNSRLIKRTADNPNGLFSEKFIDTVQNALNSDKTGMADMAVNLMATLSGAGKDYGITGVRAAKNAEGMMTRDQREALAKSGYGSSNWKSMIGDTVESYTNAARSLMYKNNGNSFVRNEEFMRGQSETDVSELLERVAAITGDNGSAESMKNNLQTIGGEAVKTLEAFKELFGNAKTAKNILNGMIGQGFSNLSADAFTSLTNTARGLMQMGQNIGVSHEAVAGMINMGRAGVTEAMGYSASDVAGGYVNENLVTNLTSSFVAQELEKSGKSDISQLSPQEQQRMKARAQFRATQFAGSSANKFMTAAVAAKSMNKLSDEELDSIMSKFRSGDREEMSAAADMVASAMDLTREDLMDTTHFKMFSEIVGSSQELTDILVNNATTASLHEDSAQAEQAIANAGLEMARNAARSTGMSKKEIASRTSGAKLSSIRRQLSEMASGGDKKAAEVLSSMNEAGLSDKEALSRFDKMRSYLADGAGDVIMTNASAEAANSLNKELYKSSGISGITANVMQSRGATLNNGSLRKVDAARLFRSLKDVYKSKGQKDKAKRVEELLSKGDFASLDSEFGSDLVQNPGIREMVLSRTTFSKQELDAVEGSSKKTNRQISNALRKGALTREESTYNGKSEKDFNVREYTGLTSDVIKKGREALAGNKKSDDGSKDIAKKTIKKATEVLNNRDLSEVEKSKKLNEVLGGIGDDEWKSVEDALGSSGKNGEALLSALKKARNDAPVEVKGRFKLGDYTFNTKDENTKKAVKNAIESDANLKEKWGDIAEDADAVFEKVMQEGDSDEAKRFIRAFGKQPGFSEISRKGAEDGVNTPAEAHGLANLANEGFGGSLTAVDNFKKAIEGLGEVTPTTTDRIRDLGEQISKLVDKAEPKNVSVAQAVTNFVQNLPEGATEVLEAGMNPALSGEDKEAVFTKAMEMLKGLVELVEKIAQGTEEMASNTGVVADAAGGGAGD